MKTYLVLGAAGSVGRSLVPKLAAYGHRVIASVRSRHRQAEQEFLRYGALVHAIEDVANRDIMEDYSRNLAELYKLNGIIYAVGHCPPNGFQEANRFPLSQLSLEVYEQEIRMHQIGLLNVFQCLMNNLERGGCFIFISSAITRLRGNFPDFLRTHYHASVIDAGHWLVEGMRHDPAINERRIKIHELAPGALDTAFHSENPESLKRIPVDQVADAIMLALTSVHNIDQLIIS